VKKVGIAILTGLISMNCFAQATVYTDTTKPITVSKASDEFIISLESNPSTGYTWFLKDFKNNLIELKSHDYQPPKDTKVGAPGRDVWEFEMEDKAFVAPQMIDLTFVYTKPWDLKTQKQEVFTVLTTDQ